MKKKMYVFSLSMMLFTMLVFPGCEEYINNVEPLREYAPDEKLNTEDNIDFLRIGVLSQFSNTSSEVCVMMDLLSDQLIFTNMMPKATYPTYNEVEIGGILGDNTNVDEIFQYVCRLRKVADDLIERTNVISFTDEAVKWEAQYVGYLYGGMARYYLANAFSIDAATPGGVIDSGPFIPKDTLLNDAITRMLAARDRVSDPAMIGVINSLIAKCFLAKQDYVNAAVYASQGMTQGDAPFECPYNNVLVNYYWIAAGYGRQQMGVHPRFRSAYLAADPDEGNRVPLGRLLGRDGQYYDFQARYAEDVSSFPIMTWQENHLMLAECAVRGTGSGDATALVNDVRTSHGIGAYSGMVDSLYEIMAERDKELFCTGSRLIDQNRGGILSPSETTAWPIASPSAPANSNHWTGPWKYMPIPRRERDSNPNLPPY